ncbi:hypothetical protein WHI96_19780 [Pseudonocardia tropica]|uniref:HTH marR-type domain-containing protein n=1 Tax=Pseudonocardia tropica TaxID=681289 RepID=A0ABV1JYK9_9PSEU
MTIPSADGDGSGAAEERVRLPQSVHTILAARLDTLTQREKSVLQDAAVIGSQVWAEPLCAMSGTDRQDVTAVLDGLEKHGVLVRNGRRSATGEFVYSFRHGLLRHVAVSQLRRRDRLARRARWTDVRGSGPGVGAPAAVPDPVAGRLSG